MLPSPDKEGSVSELFPSDLVPGTLAAALPESPPSCIEGAELSPESVGLASLLFPSLFVPGILAAASPDPVFEDGGGASDLFASGAVNAPAFLSVALPSTPVPGTV